MRQTIYLCTFMAQIIIAITVLGETNSNLDKLPVAISILGADSGDAVLVVSNSSDKNQTLVSNIPKVMDCLFAEFPTEGSFQVRNATGKRIPLNAEEKDGWMEPFKFSSHIDDEKVNNLEKTDEIKIKAHEMVKYPLKCNANIRLALSCLLDKNEFVKEYRVRIPLIICLKPGENVRVVITSEWFPNKSLLKKYDDLSKYPKIGVMGPGDKS